MRHLSTAVNRRVRGRRRVVRSDLRQMLTTEELRFVGKPSEEAGGSGLRIMQKREEESQRRHNQQKKHPHAFEQQSTQSG